MRNKPVVGQVVYSLNIGNAARGRKQVLTPATVTKVGRKYFSVVKEGNPRITEFMISDWKQRTEFCADVALYETEQEWRDEEEHKQLSADLRRAFGVYGRLKLTLHQLRDIHAIVNNEE